MTLVARRGKVVHLEAHGQMDTGKPMQTSTLFRMASMTKPITAVAILMLMEEGKLILADPVSKFIPEFANGKVAEWNQPNDARGAGVRLVPVNREMTLQDILTHTAGMTVAAEGPAGDYYARLKIAPNATLADRVKAWGAVPLNFQPGTQWRSTGGPGFDTLGPRRRDRQRHDVGSVLRAPHLPAAWHARHLLHGAGRPDARGGRHL